MDKASDFESEDCGFDPHRGQFSARIKSLPKRSIYRLLTEELARSSIVGSVVEFSPATRETGVRFPDNAGFSNSYVNNATWLLKFDSQLTTRIVGSVVEFSPATRETGVRFPVNANLLRWSLKLNGNVCVKTALVATGSEGISVPKPGIEPGTFRSSV